MNAVRSRLAPTPSGFLHRGNAYSFLLTWLITRKMGGKILLRIDDIDADRKRPEFVRDIFESINWLGIDYDEGPSGETDFEQNWSQHHRMPLYQALLGELMPHLYACTCSRSMIQSQIYPQNCRHKNLAMDTPDSSWRIRTEAGALMQCNEFRQGILSFAPAEMAGDFVVRKKDRNPSYQLVSLADDKHFGINFIVRGEDLKASTIAQLWLARLAKEDFFSKAIFLHHPLLINEAHEKLSKSAGAASLKAMRDAGQKAEQLTGDFSEWIGFPRTENLQELLRVFDPQNIRFRNVQ